MDFYLIRNFKYIDSNIFFFEIRAYQSINILKKHRQIKGH